MFAFRYLLLPAKTCLVSMFSHIRGRMAINQGDKRVELPGKGDEPHAKWPTPRAMRNLRWEGGP